MARKKKREKEASALRRAEKAVAAQTKQPTSAKPANSTKAGKVGKVSKAKKPAQAKKPAPTTVPTARAVPSLAPLPRVAPVAVEPATASSANGSGNTDELEALTVVQLRLRARAAGVVNFSRLRKAELIARLRAH